MASASLQIALADTIHLQEDTTILYTEESICKINFVSKNQTSTVKPKKDHNQLKMMFTSSKKTNKY